MSVLTPKRLEIELSWQPEPVHLREDASWLHIGRLSLSKRYASYNIGFTHPLAAAARFEREHFECGETRGWAIVFYSGGIPSDFFAAWMAEDAAVEAENAVERLNVEVQRRLADGHGDSTRPVELLTFHQGSEFAPDAAWGAEMIKLSQDGELEYEQRRAGTIIKVVRGRVDPQRVASLIEELGRTSFPTAPQGFFPPGATVCSLITEPPYRRMAIELRSGLKSDAYGQLLSALSDLCAGLRSSDVDSLAGAWQFREKPGENREKPVRG
jgi:hypothetical protein